MALSDESKDQVLRRYREGVEWMLTHEDKQYESQWLKGLKRIEEFEDRARELGVTNDELGIIITQVKNKIALNSGLNDRPGANSTK